MINREKTVRELEKIRNYFHIMAAIAWTDQGRDGHLENAKSIDDALALLKAPKKQEPIAPVVECDEYPDCTPKGFELYYCGACGDDIADGQKFCSNCGRRVQWK